MKPRADRRAVLAALALAALPGFGRAQDPRATTAQRAALDWLALVDAGDAAGSFKAASELFRGASDEARWAAALASERTPLGAPASRTLASTRFYTEIPGLPEKGEYAMLVFRTAFAGREPMSERVTLARDADGVYRVAGYDLG